MKALKLLIVMSIIFIGSIACTAGSSSEDITIDDVLNPDGYKEPIFDPNSTWVYMEGSLENQYGTENNRPMFRKWVASKTPGGNVYDNILDFSFENTDKYTRFLTDKLNPNGKEELNIQVKNFTNFPPEIGTYIMDVDKEKGYCWYNVYDSKGVKIDSTRTQYITDSSFTVTNWSHVYTSDTGGGIYKMSGNAKIKIMYWKPGTSSTTDVHNLSVTFNKILVVFAN